MGQALSVIASGLFAVIIAAVVFALYFLPTIVAVATKSRHSAAVFVIDLFFGWTFIGWVVALAMGVSGQPVRPDQR